MSTDHVMDNYSRYVYPCWHDHAFSSAEKENLCLYGFPNENWEVNLPAEEVPPELPEPALGINFARDGMQEKDWLSMIAVHSDAWLLSVAFYFGARFGFDKNDRLLSILSFWNLYCSFAILLYCTSFNLIYEVPTSHIAFVQTCMLNLQIVRPNLGR